MVTKIWQANPYFWSNILKRFIIVVLWCLDMFIALLTRVGKPFQAIKVLILPTC